MAERFTRIQGNQVKDDTIAPADLESTNALTNTYVPSYDSATGKFTWVAQSSGSGHTIQDEGVSATQRTKLNFVGSRVAVTDDVGNDATIVTVEDIGLFDIDINGDLEPVTAVQSDTVYELDGNGDIQPKSA